MDRIFIDRLQVFGRHGVLKEENTLGQMFFISAEIFAELRTAGKNDDISQTVDYGHCCNIIKDICEKKTYKLIETLAENIAEALLKYSDMINSVKIRVDKPSAPIGLPLESVGIEIERRRHTAYIALGSNMGDKNAYIRRATELVDGDDMCRVTRVSGLINTRPVSDIPQDDFLNGCMEIKTLYSPEELLARLNEIEKELGRTRDVHWGPRTVDMDIIFYDDMIIQTEKLTVPHILMHERAFVLEPLCEIAPYKIHPVFGKTVIGLLSELKGENKNGI